MVAILDVVWTAAAAGSGAGPLSGRVSARLWRVTLAIGRRPKGPWHRLLTVAGIAVVLVVVLIWATLAWVGWLLVFSASDGAVVDAASGRPAGLVERAQFAGASLFTLGSTELSAGSGAWRFAAIGATATGVVFVTLAISYFVPVASALAEGRQLGAYISSLGDSPEDVLTQAWTNGSIKGLEQHLVSLTPMVHGLAERHLTYPVVQYFHSGRERTSTALSLVVLDEAVTLLRWGLAPAARPDPVTVEPLARAIGWYLDTVPGAFVSGTPRPLPSAGLDGLRRAGIPTVDDDTYRSALENQEARRCQLAKLLVDDGWLPRPGSGGCRPCGRASPHPRLSGPVTAATTQTPGGCRRTRSCEHAGVRFEDEHRFRAPVRAVADILVDPAFHRRLELPDLELLDVVDHRDDGKDALLSLRYEYVGQLEPLAQRLLGGQRLTWIQELVVDRASGAGRLTFAVEGNRHRLHGTADFTLHTEQDETVWELRGEVRVVVPLVGGSAERRILAGVLRRLEVEAQQMTDQLRAGT